MPPYTPRMLDPGDTSSALTRPTQVWGRVIFTAGTACPRTPGLKGVPGEPVLMTIVCAAATDDAARTTTHATAWIKRINFLPLLHGIYVSAAIVEARRSALPLSPRPVHRERVG